MRILTLIGIALAMAPIGLVAAAEVSLDDETAKINYSLGYQIGGDFKRQGIEINAAAVVKGIEDALSGGQPLMSPPDMHTTLAELKHKVTAEQRSMKRNAELQYIEEGKKYLQENAAKPGVKTTASGLQYQIVEAGTGKTPTKTDQVTVNYRGTLINGQEFDSSYSRGEPATFKLSGVIPGWTEGLQLIQEGGKIKLFIPPQLAYGRRGPLGHRTLLFDVELISVGAKTAQAAVDEGNKPQ